MSTKRIDELTLKATIVASDLFVIADTEDLDSSGNPTTKKVTYDTFVASNTFILLNDTPATFTSQSKKTPRVNVGETALEFVDTPFEISGSKIVQVDTTDALQFGTGCTATGTNSATIGNGNTSTGINSLATATNSVARYHSSIAQASGAFSVAGDIQTEKFVLFCNTTNATETLMYLNQTATYPLTIAASTTVGFEIIVTASQYGGATGSVGDTWKWKLSGEVKRDASNNTTLLEVYKDIIRNQNDVNFDVNVTANDTLESLEVKVTGAANRSVRWIADVTFSEIVTS